MTTALFRILNITTADYYNNHLFKQAREGFRPVRYTANIFDVIFTVFNCVPISTVISLYGLHLIAAPSTVK